MKSIEYFTQITVDKNFKYTLSDLNPVPDLLYHLDHIDPVDGVSFVVGCGVFRKIVFNVRYALFFRRVNFQFVLEVGDIEIDFFG